MLIKGSCKSLSDLPTKGNSVGDAYLINWSDLHCWDGEAWRHVVLMPGNYVGRLKKVDLTYKGVQVSISSYDDIGELFLDPDNLCEDDLAIFDTTFPVQYGEFRQEWAKKRAIQVATEELEEWRKDYEKDA